MLILFDKNSEIIQGVGVGWLGAGGGGGGGGGRGGGGESWMPIKDVQEWGVHR